MTKTELELCLDEAKRNLQFHRQKRIQEQATITTRDGLIAKAIEQVAKCERELAATIPVDVNARTLVDGSPVTADHRELKPNGQQKDYVVLSAEERAKGFVRPVRRTYVHEKCGTATFMGIELAETYARKPDFYSGTFCVACGDHFPVGPEGVFVWNDGTKVGT